MLMALHLLSPIFQAGKSSGDIIYIHIDTNLILIVIVVLVQYWYISEYYY